MCNLYSVTKSQQAIRELAKAMRDVAGNLPPLPGIFPLPDGALRIVARGRKQDGAPEAVGSLL